MEGSVPYPGYPFVPACPSPPHTGFNHGDYRVPTGLKPSQHDIHTHALIPPVNFFPGRVAAALHSSHFIPVYPCSPPSTQTGTSALPPPAQHRLRTGERLKGIGFAGPGIREEEMQESAVLAQSTPQTAHVWLIRRIKEGNCKSGCCEEESGGRGAAELRTG